MYKVDRHRVIDTSACCWKSRQVSEEAVHGKGLRIETVEVRSRARGGCHRGRHIGWIQVCWQRRKPSTQTGEARIERRRRVEAHLRRKFNAARSNVANFDAAVAQKLMLNAQGPGEDLWRDPIRYQAGALRARLSLCSWRNVGLTEAAAGQESLSGVRYSRSRIPSGAPRGSARQRAGYRGFLLSRRL